MTHILAAVIQSQLTSTLCDPVDCSMPGFPVLQSHEEDLAKVIDLQEVIEKQEQSQMEERLAALFAHVTERKSVV